MWGGRIMLLGTQCPQQCDTSLLLFFLSSNSILEKSENNHQRNQKSQKSLHFVWLHLVKVWVRVRFEKNWNGGGSDVLRVHRPVRVSERRERK